MMKLSKNLHCAMAACMLTLCGLQPAFSQSNTTPEIASFLILVETTDDGFKLACEKGCAWKTLTFSLNPYKPQAIDQWGMTSLEEHRNAAKDPGLDDFLFTIQKNDKNKVTLEAVAGTAWKKLGFQDPARQTREYINAYGTVREQ